MNQLQRNHWLFLGAMTAFSGSLLLARIIWTGQSTYFFLNWNLFLAFVPLFLTQLLKNRERNSKITRFFVFSAWLLFFPNAPYILTDLFHLTGKSHVPIWFDLILILSYAWTGLVAGFMGLKIIENSFFTKIKIHWRQVISVIMIFAASFGIYLGRYLRFNSWDILSKPMSLFSEIGDRFIHPFDHPRTWAMTIGMGVLLNLIYWSGPLLSSTKVQFQK